MEKEAEALLPFVIDALYATKNCQHRKNKAVQSHCSVIIGNASAQTAKFNGFHPAPYGELRANRWLCLNEINEKGYEPAWVALWEKAQEFLLKWCPEWCPRDQNHKPRYMLQVAKTIGVSKHNDPYDVQDQLVMSLGSFTRGGQFVSIDKNGRETAFDTKYKLVQVDGRKHHYVTRFKGGDRYSLIFFANWTGWSGKPKRSPKPRSLAAKKAKKLSSQSEKVDLGYIHLSHTAVSTSSHSSPWTCLVDSIHFLLGNEKSCTITLETMRSLVPSGGVPTIKVVNEFLKLNGFHLEQSLNQYCTTEGVEYAVVQETRCALVLELIPTATTGKVYDQVRHCVAFDGKQIFDNETGHYVLQQSDRKTKESARELFLAPYKDYGYKKVIISNIFVLKKRVL